MRKSKIISADNILLLRSHQPPYRASDPSEALPLSTSAINKSTKEKQSKKIKIAKYMYLIIAWDHK